MNNKNRIFEIIKKIDTDYLNESKKSTKVGFHTNIENDTVQNNNFRKVLYTTKNLQLVLMSLKPNEEIGLETHPNIDQFFRFDKGRGKCIINNTEYEISDGDAIIIPAGCKHNIINTGDEDLKMYTIYAPPHHKDKTVHKTKGDAEKSNEEFDGKTTE